MTVLNSLHLTTRTAIVLAVIAFLITLACLLISTKLWKLIRRRKKKKDELHSLTPLMTTSRLAPGIRADQPIKFVVPTILVPASSNYSVTEDSMSDSDYFGITSGSDREMVSSGGGSGSSRQRHPAGRYHISPHEISKGLYPEADERKEVEAKVCFLLQYGFHQEQLLVTLLSASDLPLLEKRTKISPLAEVVLLPDKTPKFYTKTHKNNCNPIFNELFIFPAKRQSLDNRVLKISIWDYDKFSRRHFVARTFYSLSDAGISSLVTNDVLTDEIRCTLSQRKTSAQPGEILLSLCFAPKEAILKLGVLKVRFLNLKDISAGKLITMQPLIKCFHVVYVKVNVYNEKKKLRPLKTGHRRAQHEIEFNETFDVHLSRVSLSSVEIVVTVCGRSHNGIARHVFGKTKLGESCSLSQGVQHWFDMLQNQSSTIVQQHKLN